MAETEGADRRPDRRGKADSAREAGPDGVYRRYLQGRLETYEGAYKAGADLALYEAVVLCKSEGLTAPGWLLQATIKFMEDHLGKVPQGRGRTGNRLARTGQDLKHLARWDAVKEVREYQRAQRRGLGVLKGLDLSDAQRRHIAGQFRDFGTTLEDAFDHAVELLRGTPAYGSRETVRASYLKVERIMKEPEEHERFLLPQPATRRRFGLIE